MSKQRPRPPMRTAARHMYHSELPAPGRQSKEPAVVLLLPEQTRRLAELLRADCQMDELMLLRDYVKHCLRFPVTVRWLDPDVEEKASVEVCCLGLKDEYDRRGLLVKCSVEGSDKTRWIPLEQLQGPWVEDAATWDESDAQKVASRVIGDYRYWVEVLHGLDPSSSAFCDDDDDEYDDEHGEMFHDMGPYYGGGGGGGVGGESGDDELDEDGGEGGEGGGAHGAGHGGDSGLEDMEFGSELSSGALSELAHGDALDGEGGDGMEGEDDEIDDGYFDCDCDDEDLAPFGDGEEEDAEDEKLWRIGYDEDMDAGLPEEGQRLGIMDETNA